MAWTFLSHDSSDLIKVEMYNQRLNTGTLFCTAAVPGTALRCGPELCPLKSTILPGYGNPRHSCGSLSLLLLWKFHVIEICPLVSKTKLIVLLIYFVPFWAGDWAAKPLVHYLFIPRDAPAFWVEEEVSSFGENLIRL